MDEKFQDLEQVLNYYLPGTKQFEKAVEYIPNIKGKHLENAIKHIAFDKVTKENVLGILDSTLLTTFKSGLLIGRDSFFIKDVFDKFEFKYSDISGIVGNNEKQELSVYLTSRKAPIVIKYILEKYDQFAEMIQKIVELRTGKNIFIHISSENSVSEKSPVEVNDDVVKHTNEANTDKNQINENENAGSQINVNAQVIDNDSNRNVINSTTYNSSEYSDDYVIIDSKKIIHNIFGVFISICLFGVFTYSLISLFSSHSHSVKAWLVSLLLAALFLFAFLVGIFNDIPNEKYGIRINAYEGVLKYMGFPRTLKTIQLSQIQICESYDQIDVKETNEKIRFIRTYVVIISGRFGTLKKRFYSESAQKQLLAAINEFCNLG